MGPNRPGTSAVPLLPSYFLDKLATRMPSEWVFHKGFETFGGKQAVGEVSVIGREKQLSKKPKEKELQTMFKLFQAAHTASCLSVSLYTLDSTYLVSFLRLFGDCLRTLTAFRRV